jgi:hypothetical protein
VYTVPNGFAVALKISEGIAGRFGLEQVVSRHKTSTADYPMMDKEER